MWEKIWAWIGSFFTSNRWQRADWEGVTDLGKKLLQDVNAQRMIDNDKYKKDREDDAKRYKEERKEDEERFVKRENRLLAEMAQMDSEIQSLRLAEEKCGKELITAIERIHDLENELGLNRLKTVQLDQRVSNLEQENAALRARKHKPTPPPPTTGS